jgi:hypothetical protein
MADWMALCWVSTGFAFYFPRYKFIPFIFMAAYGAGMLIAATRYKIAGKYRIDSGKFGPTEMRFAIAGILLLEMALPQSVIIVGSLATLIMLANDAIEFRQLLRTADRRDRSEKTQIFPTIPEFFATKSRDRWNAALLRIENIKLRLPLTENYR